MNNVKIKKQTSKDPLWTDEKGLQIPYNRLTKSEKLKETVTHKLAKKAASINSGLITFKKEVQELCDKVYETYMREVGNDASKKKGNFIYYNFDRSIKVQVKINDRIEFDDLGIQACKDKLELFLDANVVSKDAFIKQMVQDAFETNRGKLDTKKVMSLLRYRSKVKHKNFQEALDHLEGAIRRPESRTYFMIWLRDDKGDYQSIDLNFSSLKS